MQNFYADMLIPHENFIKKLTYFFSVLRDVQERGRDLDTVLNQYMGFVKPAFEEFCLPVKIKSYTRACYNEFYSFEAKLFFIRYYFVYFLNRASSLRML